MVLLTSSSISVAISSGVVCLFTFLLFLSGYVVQQQTVRSLQAALHPPTLPTPTLPVYFEHVTQRAQSETVNVTELEEGTEVHEALNGGSDEQRLSGFQTVLKSNIEATSVADNRDHMSAPTQAANEPSTKTPYAGDKKTANTDINENLGVAADQPTPAAPAAPAETQPAFEQPARLAHVQVLSSPSQICSALLFFKVHMDNGDDHIGRVILYPSVWGEDTSSDSFTTALALMRLVKDDYKISYRPFKVGDISEERAVERELVAHLATDDWEYDRMLYLRSPGLALNIGALDSALQVSKTKALLSRNWAPVNSESSTAPSILLVSEHGLHHPRGSNRRLIAEAFTSHANHHENEMDVEAAAQTAAYVRFEEGELEHRRTEKEWYGGVFERYERGRAEICKGISFDDGKSELKKVKRRGWR